MTKTFSLERLSETLVAGEALVFSIRPPRPQHADWSVNFRVKERETAWNCGPPFATLEEAVMDALEKIERALENGNVSHLAFGRTHVPGPKRFATIEDRQKGFHRGEGNTVAEAVDSALGKLEKSWPKNAAKAPEIRYYWHPESDCVFTTEDGTRPVGDGLVEEIDRDQYLKLRAKYAKKAAPPPVAAEDDPLSDLLG